MPINIPGLRPQPKAVASSEQIRAALAAARASLPALNEAMVSAGMALAAELALDTKQRHHHGNPVDMDELHRANREAIGAMRECKDGIEALEAALPLAVQRERRATAEAKVRSQNMARENRLRALEKRRQEVRREAEYIVTALENLRNRRRGLTRLLAELEIKGVDIDRFIRETVAKVFSANDYEWKQLPLDALATDVTTRLARALADLEATPKRTVEGELADMQADDAYQARRAARAAAEFGAPVAADQLPPGMTRHDFMATSGGMVTGLTPLPVPKPRVVYLETTRDAAGNPIAYPPAVVDGQLAPAKIDGEGPQTSEPVDPSADSSEVPSAHQAPAEPAMPLVVEPEPPEVGTDNPEYQEIAQRRFPELGIEAAVQDVEAANV